MAYSGRLASVWEEKRKTNKMMEGQCKETPGVDRAEGGRREKPEQMETTRTLQGHPEREHGDRWQSYFIILVHHVNNNVVFALVVLHSN